MRPIYWLLSVRASRYCGILTLVAIISLLTTSCSQPKIGEEIAALKGSVDLFGGIMSNRSIEDTLSSMQLDSSQRGPLHRRDSNSRDIFDEFRVAVPRVRLNGRDGTITLVFFHDRLGQIIFETAQQHSPERGNPKLTASLSEFANSTCHETVGIAGKFQIVCWDSRFAKIVDEAVKKHT